LVFTLANLAAKQTKSGLQVANVTGLSYKKAENSDFDVKLTGLCYMLLDGLSTNDNAVKSPHCHKVMSVSVSRARLFKLTYQVILELRASS
jgi:hypothetical protein